MNATSSWASRRFTFPDLAGAEVSVEAVDASSGRIVPTSVSVTCETGVDGDLLRRIPLGRIEAMLNDPQPRVVTGVATSRIEVSATATGTVIPDPQLKLDVPDGRKYPDEFYKEFVERWQQLVERGVAPAKKLAEVNGVPESTVHRWTKEARRRGILRPARRKAQH